MYMLRTALVCLASAVACPLKALVWQDASGQVWVGYNDPAWISARHGVAGCPAAVNLSKALSGLVGAVTAP